jgi:hypothetical protein
LENSSVTNNFYEYAGNVSNEPMKLFENLKQKTKAKMK